MLWQNASATTVATATVGSSRSGLDQSRRSSSRTVVAPHALCLEEVRYPPDDQLSQRALVTRRVREARGTGG